MKNTRKNAKERLSIIASTYCNNLNFGNGYNYVGLRIRITSYPKWSERYTNKESYDDLDFGIVVIDKKIASIDVFKQYVLD